MPSLRTLRLVLSSNKIGDSGTQALAALQDMPSLRTLHLVLQNNQVRLANAGVEEIEGCGGGQGNGFRGLMAKLSVSMGVSVAKWV